METKEPVLSKEDFVFLDTKMREMEFDRVDIKEQIKLFRRLGLVPPREIVGREVTYSYSKNNYAAVIHTTYLEKEGIWRESGTDVGWVLIREGDSALYFARPFQRKKGFILKILRYAWITKWKVNNRPLCPDCDGYMEIGRKKNSRSYFWMCKNKLHHKDEKFVFLSWDYLLPKKATEYVKIRRDYASRYNAKNKRDGVLRKPAATIRKKWVETKPWNKI